MDQIRTSSTDSYNETRKAATSIEDLAGRFINSETGSKDETDLKSQLINEYLKAGTEQKLVDENKEATAAAQNSNKAELESAVIRNHAKGLGFHGEQNGCPDYALLHAKMTYDYFASPDKVSLIWPACKDGKLTSLEVTVPYHYDGPKTNKTIRLP